MNTDSTQSFSDAEYDPNRSRLPIHPSACVICRRCLHCSLNHGEEACNCAGLGLLTPKRGTKLPSNMQDSRSIEFNFADPVLREYTIRWVQRRAHDIYQPLYYLSVIESNCINVCSTHYIEYLTARKNHFEDTSVITFNPLRLLPGTINYDINELSRKVIHYPQTTLEYISNNSPSWNKKKLNRVENKCEFHLLRLDNCDFLTFKRGSVNISSDYPIQNTNTDDQNSNDNGQDLGKKRKRIRSPSGNTRKKSRSAKSSCTIESELDTSIQGLSNLSQNAETDCREQSKIDNSKEPAKDGDHISVSIWNAPSFSNWELTKCNSQLDNTVSRLHHLPEFIAADLLLIQRVVYSRAKNVRSLITSYLPQCTSSFSESFSVRCVKDWNLSIDLNADFGQFESVLQNNHIDLYVGLRVSSRENMHFS